MIEVSDIRVALENGRCEADILQAALAHATRILGVAPESVRDAKLHRTSIDARKKNNVHLIVSIRLALESARHEEQALGMLDPKNARHVKSVDDAAPCFPANLGLSCTTRPVVVGAGCAGLFAALTLASAGLEPLLIERGSDAERRSAAVDLFNRTGKLDPNNNIQFGLGGAGTFSDGKLNTGTKNADHRLILETFVDAGAPREILWEAKPHIGSDILPGVVTSMVERIRELGGEVRFDTRLVDIKRTGSGAIAGIVVETDGTEETISCEKLILCCGHSARDVFELLKARGFELMRKTFAMGVRIEHLQEDIDRAQYGDAAGDPALGAAPYKLVTHTRNGRSLFSFCMCPGGEVVAAASEEGRVCTNGASLHARDGVNANAALLVNVNPEDLEGEDVLAGIELQRTCEKMAFDLGGGEYRAPAQLVGDYLVGIPSSEGGAVVPTYPRGVTWGPVGLCLPAHVDETLRQGIPELAMKLKGFGDPEAVLTGVETRSSSPVTVVRDKECHAIGAEGLYPCGEGAGYAGGIMSAAADGIRCARALIKDVRNR